MPYHQNRSCFAPSPPPKEQFLRELSAAAQGTRPVELPAAAPAEFALWLADPQFERRVRAILHAARRRGEIALAVAAGRAAERLAASVDDPAALDAAARRACVDLVRLARVLRPNRRKPAGSVEAQAGPHPDVEPADVSALLSALE